MENAEQKPSRSRLRFSLLALFVFVTLACFALAWWVRPKRAVATALFQVHQTPETILEDAASNGHDPQEFETVQNTQLALLHSNMVLASALRKPAVASLAILAGKPDPIAWLQENLEADFPLNAEILEIRLRGPRAHVNDLVQLADAVATAYEDEVLSESLQRRLASRDLKARTLKKLRDELTLKMQEFQDEDRETGGELKASVDGRMRQMELDILTEQCLRLSRSLELDDIEANAPPRIRKIQNAVPSFE